MEAHEQAELEKVMRQSLAKYRHLTKDKRIVKAGAAGVQYCKSKGLTSIEVGLFDEKGNITPLRGDEALSYMMVGMASELVEER